MDSPPGLGLVSLQKLQLGEAFLLLAVSWVSESWWVSTYCVLSLLGRLMVVTVTHPLERVPWGGHSARTGSLSVLMTLSGAPSLAPAMPSGQSGVQRVGGGTWYEPPGNEAKWRAADPHLGQDCWGHKLWQLLDPTWATLTTALLVWAILTVHLAITPPELRNATVDTATAAEVLQLAGDRPCGRNRTEP